MKPDLKLVKPPSRPRRKAASKPLFSKQSVADILVVAIGVLVADAVLSAITFIAKLIVLL